MSGAHEGDLVSLKRKGALKFAIIYARAREMINSAVMTG